MLLNKNQRLYGGIKGIRNQRKKELMKNSYKLLKNNKKLKPEYKKKLIGKLNKNILEIHSRKDHIKYNLQKHPKIITCNKLIKSMIIMKNIIIM